MLQQKKDYFIVKVCESVEFYENDKLINFWSNKFINEEIKRDFKITGWRFMTLVKGNTFFEIQSVCY